MTQLLEPVVDSLGYELVLLEFVGQGRAATLRLFIDAPDGIAVEDCEKVSREVAATLDVEDPITQAYQLEVSSPGLDRPLVKPQHFERFCGESARIETFAPIDGRRRFRGVLEGCENGVVRLRTDQGDFALPLSAIERARLVPTFEVRDRDE